MSFGLDMELIRRDLPTVVVARSVQYLTQVGSTNDLVRAQARAGHGEGLVIVAEEQTAGRGRMGRGWIAPPGRNLLLSILLRPTWLPAGDAFSLTMLAGVALCEAVEGHAALRASLKWPNDLMLPVRTAVGTELRKAAGILSELDVGGERVEWAVLGMGVNVNWAPSGVIDGKNLSEQATSVSEVLGAPVDRLGLLRALLLALDRRYLALRDAGHDELFADWRSRLATLGQAVTVRTPTGDLRGVAEDVAASGALLLRDEEGRTHQVLTGDVGV